VNFLSIQTVVPAALQSLEADLPNIIQDLGRGAEFWRVFAERASAIEDLAGPDGWIYANAQLGWMLERLRIDPSGWNGFFNA
jgi:hypothetical protein